MVFPTNSTEAIPFTEYLEDENTQLYYLHKKDSIDIGLIPLRHRHENQIKGETFITEIHYRNLPSKYTGCILIGFPSSHEKFEANFINLNPAYVLVRRILDNPKSGSSMIANVGTNVEFCPNDTSKPRCGNSPSG